MVQQTLLELQLEPKGKYQAISQDIISKLIHSMSRVLQYVIATICFHETIFLLINFMIYEIFFVNNRQQNFWNTCKIASNVFKLNYPPQSLHLEKRVLVRRSIPQI